MTIELFDPTVRAQLGPYTLTSGIAVDVYSSKDTYFDWAKVTFAEAYLGKISLDARQEAAIHMGYGAAQDLVFSGMVSQPYNSAAGQNEVLLKDNMLRLEQTYLSDAFLDVRPQEILEALLGQAGISDYQLATGPWAPKPVVPIRRKNGIEVIQQINALWGIDAKFFFSRGVFYWGIVPPQAKSYQFVYGSNILHLTRQGGLWELETVSVPFIHHSDRIAVQAPAVSGTFEVVKTHFSTEQTGFVRAYLYF